jgi:hypothetical protein
MEKSTRNILIGAGILGLIGYYLYKSKKTTTTTSTPITDKVAVQDVTPTAVVTPVVVHTPEVVVVPDVQQNVPIATPIVPQAPINVTPIVVANPIIHPVTGKLVPPISIGGTPQTNPKQPSSSSELLSSPGISMKDTTLEDQNAGLGSLTTAGKDYTNIDNPTGYVDPNAYPDTIVILPQAEGEYTSIPNIEAPSTPDTLPTDIPSWAQQGPDPVLDSANIDNYDYYYSGFGDTQGGDAGGQQTHRGDETDPYGYGGIPSS